jgi:hypothetical protein
MKEETLKERQEREAREIIESLRREDEFFSNLIKRGINPYEPATD